MGSPDSNSTALPSVLPCFGWKYFVSFVFREELSEAFSFGMSQLKKKQKKEESDDDEDDD